MTGGLGVPCKPCQGSAVWAQPALTSLRAAVFLVAQRGADWRQLSQASGFQVWESTIPALWIETETPRGSLCPWRVLSPRNYSVTPASLCSTCLPWLHKSHREKRDARVHSRQLLFCERLCSVRKDFCRVLYQHQSHSHRWGNPNRTKRWRLNVTCGKLVLSMYCMPGTASSMKRGLT